MGVYKRMETLQSIANHLMGIKEKKPLVHHITNYVTVNECANMTLAIGASPVMAEDIDEVEEMVSFASALVINMGTLNSRTIASMLAAGKKARQKGIPIIFDPVGVGATHLRSVTAEKIIREVCPSVIRGNMSEIKIIAGLAESIKGVDSVASAEDGEEVAQTLSHKLNSIIAITGKQDIVAQGNQILRINNGDAMLSQVTGTGCMATTLIACFCGATDNWFEGAAAGIMTMGLAGEMAKESLHPGDGIGTFRMRLFDSVSIMTKESFIQRGKIEKI